MTSQEPIIVDDYKFSNFEHVDSEYKVTFRVEWVRAKQLTKEDFDSVIAILNDSGKWEKLIVGNLYLFSELTTRPIDETILKNYEKTSGIELNKAYRTPSLDIRFEQKSSHNYLFACIRLNDGELIKRQDEGIRPIFSIEEIYNPLMNVPKWRALKKTIKIIREELLSCTQ
jgi:hypothetical protein